MATPLSYSWDGGLHAREDWGETPEMAKFVRPGPLIESWILGLLICKSQMICACYLRSAENFK